MKRFLIYFIFCILFAIGINFIINNQSRNKPESTETEYILADHEVTFMQIWGIASYNLSEQGTWEGDVKKIVEFLQGANIHDKKVEQMVAGLKRSDYSYPGNIRQSSDHVSVAHGIAKEAVLTYWRESQLKK